jgi:predicted permease
MLRRFLSRLRGHFQREERIDEEIATHLEMLAAEFESRGMTPRQAHLAARRAFGGVARTRENWRAQHGLPLVESMAQDLRYAGGQIAKNPGFAAVAVLTLALGIGANTVVYQVLDSVVYRALPVRAPQQLQLLKILEDGKPSGGGQVNQDFSYSLFRALAERQTVADSMFAVGSTIVTPPEGGEKLPVSLVSGNYFQALGASAGLGRALTPADDRPGAPAVAVISHRFWEKRYGSNPSVIGRSLRVGRGTVTVAGIARPEFYGTTLGWEPDVWLPTSAQPQILPINELADDNSSWLNVMLRLKHGVSPKQAQAQLAALYHAQTNAQNRRLIVLPGYRGIPMIQAWLEPLAIVSMALVGVVLLIACCNLANLVLGRGAARRHEIGVRLALGAGRGRIVRQLLTESLALAVCGALAALALAAWSWPVLRGFMNLPVPAVGLNSHTMVFTTLAAIFATALFGLAPAWATTRLDLLPALQANRCNYSGGPSAQRLGRLLIGVQISVSVLLLYGAGLLGRSLWNLEHQDYGFRTDRLLLAHFAWNPEVDFQSGDTLAEDKVAQPLYERLNTLPGVVSAAVYACGPLGNSTETTTLSTPEHPSPAENDTLEVHVSPRYFETMGTPILRGRAINDGDRAAAPRVVVLSQTEARRLFGNTDPIGRMVSPNKRYLAKEALQVIGVARDIRFSGPHDTSNALYYVPLAQSFAPVTSLAVRTTGDTDAAVAAIRAALHQIAPARELARIEPVQDTLEEALAPDYLLSLSSGGFSLLALALTALGVYGVIAYSLAGRTREIGIRLALGATRGSLAGMVAREYAWLVTLSAAAGAAGAMASAGLLRERLFGVAPNDSIALLAAVVLLAVVAAVAGWRPVYRAGRVDPTEALREE